MAAIPKGNCYICGAQLGKQAMKNHIMKVHAFHEDGQICRLLKIEGADDKNYWLYVDVPATCSLSVVDTFLRKIWLDCCGHMSAFFGSGYTQIGKKTKLGEIPVGAKLIHEYDFGSTTECLITVVGDTVREKGKRGVRLLARNIPPEFICGECGAAAEWISPERVYTEGDPFLCDKCSEEFGDGILLPVTNSPRMGVCGYCGDQDSFIFVRPEVKSTETEKGVSAKS